MPDFVSVCMSVSNVWDQTQGHPHGRLNGLALSYISSKCKRGHCKCLLRLLKELSWD